MTARGRNNPHQDELPGLAAEPAGARAECATVSAVPPGYKQTEVGVIPVEWEVKTLGSLTTLLTNGFVGTATTAYVESEDGVLYIQGYNVQENGFNFHGIKRVSKAFHARNKKSCLQSGDLLTIQTGDIGVTTVVPPELAGANCHALIISRLRKQDSAPGYYCQYFNSERGRVAFKEIETGTTMKHLNGGDMKRLFLPSPPVEEQRAIAAALSDVDGLLGALERLIAKKRDLKQAAMQQLLTGQQRLSGFTGKWETKRLGDFVKADKFAIVDGPFGTQMKVEEYVTDGIPVIEMEHLNDDIITKRLERCITPKKFEQLKRSAVYPGDIIISKTGSLGYLGILPENVEQGIITSRLAKISLNPSRADRRFVFQYLLKLRNDGYWESVSQGGTMQILGIRMLQNTPIPQISLSEQTAIAAVLSDMDAELAALEARRDKTRALKQGMMQELLTGRARLLKGSHA